MLFSRAPFAGTLPLVRGLLSVVGCRAMMCDMLFVMWKLINIMSFVRLRFDFFYDDDDQ